MAVTKLSISLEKDLSERVRAAARRARTPVSAWMAEAAKAKLRRESLVEFFEEYEAEHGVFTEEEKRRADEELGFVEEDS